MDHIKSLFTCRPTQAPEPPTLDELCHDLDIQAMSQGLSGSSAELRANSVRGPVRLKKGYARMTNLNTRKAHRENAYAFVHASFEKSVDLHRLGVAAQNQEFEAVKLSFVWYEAAHANRRDKFITLQEVRETRENFEKVRLARTIPKKVESTRPNLSALSEQLELLPQGPKGEDSELRADSDSDRIRVKTRTALVTRVSTRRTHQARAHALVRAAFLRQVEFYETKISPDVWLQQKVRFDDAWATEISPPSADIRPITRRKVNCLTKRTEAIFDTALNPEVDLDRKNSPKPRSTPPIFVSLLRETSRPYPELAMLGRGSEWDGKSEVSENSSADPDPEIIRKDSLNSEHSWLEPDPTTWE